jgi:alpha-tubulin suppressor-like RCC1 family protein
VTGVYIAYRWGDNGFGQLVVDGTTSSAVPLMVPTTNESGTIAAGAGHPCATATGGPIKCWGDNSGGQLGGTGTLASPAVTGVS